VAGLFGPVLRCAGVYTVRCNRISQSANIPLEWLKMALRWCDLAPLYWRGFQVIGCGCYRIGCGWCGVIGVGAVRVRLVRPIVRGTGLSGAGGVIGSGKKKPLYEGR
jgi:hypothetical protein